LISSFAVRSGTALCRARSIVQIATAHEHNIDPGLSEGGSAQLQQQVGDVLAVPPRDLQPASTNIPGQDGERNAQRGLAEGVHLVNLRAFADQELDDIIQPLIRSRVQCRPTVLSNGGDISAALDKELCCLDRCCTLLGRPHPLDVGATPGRQHQGRGAMLGGSERVRAGVQQRLHSFKVVNFSRQHQRRRTL